MCNSYLNIENVVGIVVHSPTCIIIIIIIVIIIMMIIQVQSLTQVNIKTSHALVALPGSAAPVAAVGLPRSTLIHDTHR